MIRPSSLTTAALVSVTALATTALIQACGGGAHAQAAPDPIIGVWFADVQRRDCTTGAVLVSLRGIDVFNAGGTLVDLGVTNPASRTAALGQWSRESEGRYAAKFVFATFLADGSPSGTTEGARTLRLSADGNTLSGETAVTIKDAQGQVIARACAVDTSVRFQ